MLSRRRREKIYHRVFTTLAPFKVRIERDTLRFRYPDVNHGMSVYGDHDELRVALSALRERDLSKRSLDDCDGHVYVEGIHTDLSGNAYVSLWAC